MRHRFLWNSSRIFQTDNGIPLEIDAAKNLKLISLKKEQNFILKLFVYLLSDTNVENL